MKAITIWQPYASLIANGAKIYETRGWATKYRGPIAIHAAKKDPLTLPAEIREAMERHGGYGTYEEWARELPRGSIIATAELVHVFRIERGPISDRIRGVGKCGDLCFYPNSQEIALGDWTPGRYAWELRNVKVLPQPIPCKGQQGLWNWVFRKE